MGFWDEHQQTSGLNFVGAEEKSVLIDEAVPLTVERVFKATSKFGPRYVVVTTLDGEERALGFAAGSVDSRDQTFDAMIGYLEREDAEPPVVVLKRAGRSVIVDRASE